MSVKIFKLVRACVLLVLFWLPAATTRAEPPSTATVPGSPWPATDELGRALPLAAEVGPPQSDRFVGIFYFLWHNQPGNTSRNPAGPPDVSRILASDPLAVTKPGSPLWGGLGEPHYWGQPLFGYYRSTDPWVLRRHAYLLADAGIDTLIFDTTNAATYPDVYLKLCEVFATIRKEGGRTPQIAFMVNTAAQQSAMQLWQEFYSKNLYRDLWFRWQGKPLLLCDPGQANDTLRKIFTLRRAHWPFEMINTDLAWHWEATYPQPYGFAGDPKRPEQVSVSVAQNLRVSDGLVTNMSTGDARGRSFHDGRQDPDPGAVNFGYNFQEQWKRAIALKSPFVLVTGWNEWTAARYQRPEAPVTFVDQYNQEFSRDIEPMRGGHGDNYYYQLVANVRRYKGAPRVTPSPAHHSIDIAGDFSQWDDVKTVFKDHIGETIPREADGVGGTHYSNHSGRNDIVESKVCRDATRTYFWVRTRTNLSAATDPNWMWLLIDRDQNSSTGWHGYDLIVNRSLGRVESNDGGWKWKDVAKVDYRIQGDQLQLAVPNELFGANPKSLPTTFDFKWADNLQHVDDIMDFYLSGDVAPGGRFRYRCELK
jgi:hypothetical protein